MQLIHKIVVVTFHQMQKKQIQNVLSPKDIKLRIGSQWETLGWNLDENSEYVQYVC